MTVDFSVRAWEKQLNLMRKQLPIPHLETSEKHKENESYLLFCLHYNFNFQKRNIAGDDKEKMQDSLYSATCPFLSSHSHFRISQHVPSSVRHSMNTQIYKTLHHKRGKNSFQWERATEESVKTNLNNQSR